MVELRDGYPCFQGIKAVIAESYERIHRSNLVGMGVIPLEYLPGDTAESLGLTGRERYTIIIPEKLTPRMVLQVKVCQVRLSRLHAAQVCDVHFPCLPSQLDGGKTFQVRMRFDTDVELTYFHNGGILNYMIRKMSLG